MAELEPPQLIALPEALPEPVAAETPCEHCQAPVKYLRVTTPPGMPDFIHPLDDFAWFGWSWSGDDQALSLVATCSRGCLGEWWASCTEPGL